MPCERILLSAYIPQHTSGSTSTLPYGHKVPGSACFGRGHRGKFWCMRGQLGQIQFRTLAYGEGKREFSKCLAPRGGNCPPRLSQLLLWFLDIPAHSASRSPPPSSPSPPALPTPLLLPSPLPPSLPQPLSSLLALPLPTQMPLRLPFPPPLPLPKPPPPAAEAAGSRISVAGGQRCQPRRCASD